MTLDNPTMNGIPLDWEGQTGQWRRYLLDLRTHKSKTPSQRIAEELFHVYHHTEGSDDDQASAMVKRARLLLAPPATPDPSRRD